MSAESHAKVRQLFLDACRLDKAERTRYLNEACAGEPNVRAEVDMLLAADEEDLPGRDGTGEGAAMLAHALAQNDELAASTDDPKDWLPPEIGGYRIVRLIGRGGMGLVYEAEQKSPKRRVAIKLMHPMLATTESMTRFRREAELLGRLQHPGIAQIIEASTYDLGRGWQPFFAMELVDGLPVTEYAEANALDTRARLALIVELCDALEYAHTKGVIHRDLKPANILVATEENSAQNATLGTGRARIKVLDFGVARATDSDLTAATLQTSEGQLIGTISYMSPEQAAGQSKAIDQRCDVYSIGVITFELLARCLPYGVRGKILHEAVRIIREDDPSSLGTFDGTLRGDVETIVAKALEKDPRRRYASAAEMAADLRRHMDHLPISARPPSTLYQLRKFTRRNRVLVGGVVATLVVALAGTMIAAKFALDANRRTEELTKVADFQAQQLRGIDPVHMGADLRRFLLGTTRSALEREGTKGDDLDRRMDELEALLSRTNFTDVALRALDENLFSQTQIALAKQFVDQPAVEGRLLEALANTMRLLGLVGASVEPRVRALELLRRALGDEHPDTLTTLHELGYVRFLLGDHAEGELLIREALESRRRILPRDHADIWQSLAHLSHLLSTQGRAEEGIPVRRELVELSIQIMGADNPRTLQSKADLLVLEGRLDEAVPCLRQSLAWFRREHGDDSLSATITMRNLAELLVVLGELDEAEDLMREALMYTRSTTGESSPETLANLKSLSRTLRIRGKLVESRTLLTEAYTKETKLLGADHPDTLATGRALEE